MPTGVPNAHYGVPNAHHGVSQRGVAFQNAPLGVPTGSVRLKLVLLKLLMANSLLECGSFHHEIALSQLVNWLASI
ncbi:hypothetical protein PIB30_024174 [Stylosanthes scabra]|uniref:Uncharacterized protein n=1 Tax=Stylosanthes scabra TaxID=79078 RepID=A0ABU6YBJ2_9FABA|nr:hypothetical protein [Stylosanthes scabra]